MNRMIEIAKQLGALYATKAGCLTEIDAQQAEYDARLLTLTPETGWPGKNEQERKTAEKKAEAGDAILAQMRANQADHRAHLADFEAQIAALEAERRALEWQIRADMVKAIGGRADAGHVETHGAPDAQLETLAWDEQVFKLAEPATVDMIHPALLAAVLPADKADDLEALLF